jgi:hypothetical protein
MRAIDKSPLFYRRSAGDGVGIGRDEGFGLDPATTERAPHRFPSG